MYPYSSHRACYWSFGSSLSWVTVCLLHTMFYLAAFPISITTQTTTKGAFQRGLSRVLVLDVSPWCEWLFVICVLLLACDKFRVYPVLSLAQPAAIRSSMHAALVRICGTENGWIEGSK